MHTASTLSAFWPATAHDPWMTPEGTPGLVSVVIPTYNREAFLPGALDSVRRQSYRPIEIVVADDGSTDDTEAVVDAWRRRHAGDALTVRYVRQANAGGSAARNLGLLHTTGAYVQFLDSDDALHPDKLTVHVDAMEQPPVCDYVWSPMVETSRPETPVAEWVAQVDVDALDAPRWGRADDRATLRHQVPASLYAGLYRRRLCAAIGPLDETLPCWQDRDYQYRLEAVGGTFRYVDRPLAFHFFHDGEHVSRTSKTRKGIEACLRVLDHARAAFDQLNLDRPLHGQYVRVLSWALAREDADLIKKCLRRVQQTPRVGTRGWSLLLHVVLLLLGPRAAHLAFRAYRTLRGY